jgi:alcohol dehydrogenase class IV
MSKNIDATPLENLQANWNYPTSIRFGAGQIRQLKLACNELNINKPLLVTDEGLAGLDFVAEIIKDSEQGGIQISVFSDIQSNPTGDNVSAGVQVYHQGKHDGVIALGGGSSLDAGKAIALMVGQDRPIWDYEDVGENWLRVNPDGMAPVIAVPTTAGTGSEVGRASVIRDEFSQSKKIIFHPGMLPARVIADPELTIGLPAHITAATGIDAFVHSLEAYCATAYHPMADGIALESMRLIKNWLPIAFEDGSHLTARSHMLAAASMGAVAFQKGLGAVHALAHPLGAVFNKHHGLLNAILLPYVLQRNKSAVDDKIVRLSRYLDLGENTFESFYQWILTFRKELKIPNDLQAIGITLEQSERVGKLATQDPSAAGNPIAFTASQYTEIFEAAVKGDISG